MGMSRAKAVVWKVFHRDYAAARSQRRLECRLDASLTLIESGIVLKGKILDIASKGALFRPPQVYLLNRAGGFVRLSVGESVVEGVIVNTTSRGYGVHFRETLSLDAIMS